MLDLEDLPALLCKTYKLKWFGLYTSQTDTVKYHKKIALRLVKVHKI